ncbi:MAG: hypothetical protein A2W00_08280 [Candidatus Eisenbacteria bacterium RBG_16_71_46]|nr:MAG: hypothetical protein A2W00_08280 [Candidatus Eisenbacteria bacterium RBG_16_71_46]
MKAACGVATLTFWLVLGSHPLLPPAASAQRIRPWVPPFADSLTRWAADARAGFATNTGDSVGGENYRAYELVGTMGRRLLRALGKQNTLQAHAIEPVLDSLGLDTEVALDPTLPRFVLLMVHNPARPSAQSVGFFYWFRGEDLRMEGAAFGGGDAPKVRVWWTGQRTYPYEWGVIDRRRDTRRTLGFTLLRLSEDGLYWNLTQYAGSGPDLGEMGDAEWADLNGDGRPELVAWSRAPVDSLFEVCSDCPRPILERTYAERREGFTLNDERLVPTPFASFVLFIRLLRERNPTAAARLLEDPSMVRRAMAEGWATGRGRGLWRVEYFEEGEAWPAWFAIRFRGGKGKPLYIVHFTQKEGRWVIRDWIVPVKAPEPASPPAGGAR